MREWDKERARGCQAGWKGKNVEYFQRKGWGEVNQKGDRSSETTSQTCSL